MSLTRSRAARCAAALASTCAVLASAPTALASLPGGGGGPAPVPCKSIGGGKYDCTFWPAGDGIHGGAPVLNSAGARVGYLNQGTNWVICQRVGSTLKNGSTANNWWAYTEANDRKWGWVNAIYAHGGANFGAFGGVPVCTNHGNPPGGSASPAPPPPPAPPPAPSPAQAPCTNAGGGKYNCSFWPAGDGIHGGAPVLSSAGVRVGYLNQGTDWVLCQQAGREQTSGAFHNKWWAFTKANNLRSGWVNAVYARGGANDGQFANVPSCGGRHGATPGVSRARPPAPKAPPCKRYEMLGLRGSGEAYAGYFNMGDTVGLTALYALQYLPKHSVRTFSIPYPAAEVKLILSDPDAFFTSLEDGAFLLVGEVRRIEAHCPSARIAIIGYSQGAGAASEGIRMMSLGERRRIASVVLYADTYSKGNSPYAITISYFGNNRNPKRDGHGIFGAKSIPLPAKEISDVCFDVDPVCVTGSAGTTIVNALLASVHTQYKSFFDGVLPKVFGRHLANGLKGTY
jgi:Cutinase